MYPWEHFLLGYVLYSGYLHAIHGRSPTAAETLAVVTGSQFPDLVDKPLAWTWGITETGYAVGHSIFSVPVVLTAVYLGARRIARPQVALAFSIAYLSHLASDVVYPIVFGRGVEPRVVLWPIASPPGSGIDGGFVERTIRYLDRFLLEIAGGEFSAYLVFQVGLAMGVLGVWVYDGAPVASELISYVRQADETDG